MVWAFILSGFLINTIGLCLLQFSSKKVLPEISHDANPRVTNPTQQRYNSSFLNVTSPLCVLTFVEAMVGMYIGHWAQPGEILAIHDVHFKMPLC